MKVEMIIQKEKENTTMAKIAEAFSKNPKKVYFILGTIKDTGFKIIEEELIDTKSKLYFYIGIDKKNTTKIMLDSLVKYSNDVYVYSNNEQIEFNSNIIIFEYTDTAVIYNFAGTISEATLVDNILLYNEIIYDLKDSDESKEYKNTVKQIKKEMEEKFEKINKTKIEELVESKEIFSTRQYVHSVKSIAELLGNSQNSEKEEQPKEDSYDIDIPKVDLSSIDIDIDIDMPEEIVVKEDNKNIVEEKKNKKETKKIDDNDIDIEPVEKENDVQGDLNINDVFEEISTEDEDIEDMEFDSNSVLDINSMLFSKSNIELDVDDEKEEEKETNEIKEDELLKVKKVNLNAISNFIYELPNKATKGQEATSLKIPSYIQNMIPDFFELSEKGKNTKINDADYKVREINIEIVDVKSNEKYSDRDAKIMQKNGQTYMLISSNILKSIAFEEKDIARIIKLSSDTYHIEIISKQLQEYKVWSKVCNQSFKSTDRHYGMM